MTTGTVEALYSYSYKAGDGRTIAFTAGERFSLLNKTNSDWWQVRRGTEKPMYVPANYVQEIYERRGNVVYENVHIGETGGVGLNLSAATSEESGRSSQDSLDSKEEESESFLNLENGADNETKNEENKISDSCSEVKGVSSGVKSLAKSLEQSGASLRGGSFSVPSKTVERPKSQSLPVGWALVTDEGTGRPYYFNYKTNETSWKPPRIARATSPSPTSQCSIAPFGWRISTASCADEPVYINEHTDEKWQSSKDEKGRVYYYQVNGAATSWELPEVDPASRQSFEALDVTYRRRSPNLSLRNSKCHSMQMSIPQNSHSITGVNQVCTPDDFAVTSFHERTESVQSRDSVCSSGGEEFAWPEPPTPTTTLAVNFFQEIEKQGLLNRKKVSEGGGRKVKKVSWTTSFVILFSSNMVFYKDQKAAQQKPGLPHGKPESSCVLQGALLDWASPSSTKKKNAFQIQTVSGLVFLLQHDHQMEASNWFNAIASVIQRLREDESSTPATVQYQPSQGQSSAAIYDSDDPLDEPGVPNSLAPGVGSTGMRSRRSGSEREESKNRIKDRLRKLISRRPPMEELEKKGILKESVFGCHIAKLCEKEKEFVPLFVTNCITAIEKRGLSFDGLYRVCGNVSTVQKIRIMVDQEEKITLGEPPFDDVHALTGTLKLYFRELPEPLIPFDFFSGFVVAIKQSTRKDKLKAMRSLVTQMPKVNCETLKTLLRHLQKLMEQSEENRMTAQNLAIVWGPNLMWPRHDAGDIAVNMVHQNQIIEFLLLEFEQVFK